MKRSNRLAGTVCQDFIAVLGGYRPYGHRQWNAAIDVQRT